MEQTLGFCSWYLGMGSVFPYPSYYAVFLRESIERPMNCNFANLSILGTSLLHDPTVIDQAWESRKMVAMALCEQYFGMRVGPYSSDDGWLVRGLAAFLAGLLLRVVHGHNEYRYQLGVDRRRVFELEGKLGLKVPPLYGSEAGSIGLIGECLALKARLVVVMMEGRLDKTASGVFQRMLGHLWTAASSSTTTDAEVNEQSTSTSSSPSLSTANFLKLAKRMTGKDWRSFANSWIYGRGCPQIHCSFSINKRRSLMEVEIRQSTPNQSDRRFVGTVLIRVHELDGVFDHAVHIDDRLHHLELPLHSKLKKARKKRGTANSSETALSSVVTVQEAVEDKTSDSSAAATEDSQGDVVCWVRLDPEMEWLGDCLLDQPDFMWIAQLEGDRDAVSQSEALYRLSDGKGAVMNTMEEKPSLVHLPTNIVDSIDKVIRDGKIFWRVRRDACLAMASVVEGFDRLIRLFSERYSINSSNSSSSSLVSTLLPSPSNTINSANTNMIVVPTPNKFEGSLPGYFVKKAIVEAIGICANRAQGDRDYGLISLRAVKFLWGLLWYNDNSQNGLSDNYYLATCIEALSEALVASLDCPSSETLNFESLKEQVISELNRYQMIEKICPFHRNNVMQAIIKARRHLNHYNLIQDHETRSFLAFGHSLDVRLAALECLNDYSLILKVIYEDASRFIQREGVRVFSSIAVNTKDVWLELLQNCREGLLPVIVASLTEHFDPREEKTISVEKSSEAGSSLRITLNVGGGTASSGPKEEPLAAAIEDDEADWISEIQRDLGISKPLPKIRLAVPAATMNVDASVVEEGMTVKSKLLQVFERIWANYDSYAFRYPVDRSVPGYHEIIKEPIDLSTIRSKHFSSLAEESINVDDFVSSFATDLGLMFANCRQFNQSDSIISDQARRLERFALKDLKRTFPNHYKLAKRIILRQNSSAEGGVQPNVSVDENRKIVFKLKLNNSTSASLEDFEWAMSVVERLMAHEMAGPFLQPVDPIREGVPTYLQVIQNPMDLSTIRERLRKSINRQPMAYTSIEEVKNDLDLCWNNCWLFNGKRSEIGRWASVMAEYSDSIWRKQRL